MKYLALAFTVLVSFSVGAQDFEGILRRADELANYGEDDFSAEYVIVKARPGQAPSSTTAAVFRRDREDSYVILITAPSVKRGQGFLKSGSTLWVYDPQGRRFNSTSSTERFQNTNARNSDFTRSTLVEDYTIVEGAEARLGKYNCWLLTLAANNDEVTYPRMKIWISQEDGLVRKSEDYSLSGQLLRTTAIPAYYKVGDHYVPQRVIFVDALRGAMVDGKFRNEQTKIVINRPTVKPLEDNIFSKSFLESMSR